ncbi:MAG: tyrosinase family protein [Pseudomonadota bacterium]
MKILKYVLGIGLVFIFICAGHVLALQATSPEVLKIAVASQHFSLGVKYRKNIDDLTPMELAAYEHAVKMIKIKSQHNVFDRTGFIWQSWVHNCTAVTVFNSREATLSETEMNKYLLSKVSPDSCNIATFLDMPGRTKVHTEQPGECEHQKNIFLPWHRAQLYFYERALQAADPEGTFGPSTKNVALPYWNFTQKPSGVRYPKAFENPASPLFDSTRKAEGLTSSLPTSSPYLLAYILYFDDWLNFGGDKYGSNNGGTLETKIHNQMHASYIGGHMQDNATAALDPVFYVFHNFLDYSFEKWMEIHGANQVTGSEQYMRAEQDASLPLPQGFAVGDTKMRTDSGKYLPTMGQAGIYFDTQKQGYVFHPGRYDEFISKTEIQRLIDQHQAAGFVFGDNQISLFSALLSYGSSGSAANPKATLLGSYSIPQQISDKSQPLLLTFTRKQTKPDYSFQADVYLYPEGVVEDIANREFRDRYLVTNTVHWGLSGAHQHGDIKIGLNVTGIINSLVPTRRGEKWNIALALSGKDDAAIKSKDFSKPTIVNSSLATPHTQHYSGSAK